jgi:hypothetical protein
MKNILRFVCTSIFGVLFTACAHHRDVRPGASGSNRVVTTAAEAEEASRSAISQANHYCGQFKQAPRIVSEKTTYTGEMDENTRKTIRKASNAAILVGGVYSDPGKPDMNPVVGAGTVGAVMTNGEDYRTEMVFECK